MTSELFSLPVSEMFSNAAFCASPGIFPLSSSNQGLDGSAACLDRGHKPCARPLCCPTCPTWVGQAGGPHRFGSLPQAAVLEVWVVGQRPSRAQLDSGQQLHAPRKHSRPWGVRAKRLMEGCCEPLRFPGTSSTTPMGLGTTLRGQGMHGGWET